jgi:hypothetical protein
MGCDLSEWTGRDWGADWAGELGVRRIGVRDALGVGGGMKGRVLGIRK